MTAKRFLIVENDKNYLRIDDKTKEKFYLNEREIVECLNNLHEENEQLRKKITKTEKIKQQRDFYYARLQRIIKTANGDFE